MIINKNYISTPFFVALVLMAMSIPLSLYTMSVCQFILTIFWAYEGADTKNKKLNYWLNYPLSNAYKKLLSLKSNKLAITLLSYYCIHIIGLLFTYNVKGALEVLRLNVPIIVFIVIISTSKALSRNQLNVLLILFVAAVISASFFGFYVYIKQEFSDIRELSQFMHPIKFSLSICYAIFILIYFIHKKLLSDFISNLVFVLGILWLVFYLTVMESGSGLITVLIIGYSLLMILLFNAKSKLKIVFITILIFIPLFAAFYLNDIVNDFTTKPQIDFLSLDKETEKGNPYVHDTINFNIEEGNYVGLYICEQELEEAWELRSSIAFEGRDKSNQEIKRTLIRFLNSMNFRKDFDGVNQLTDDQVKAIERGIANISYIENPGIKTRIHKFLVGLQNYKQNKNPNGNSLIQRKEYLNASIELIKQNFWFGVGTGDITPAFKTYYYETNSKLLVQNRLLSHNQYLHTFITYGVWGIIWFLAILYYPLSCKSNRKNYFYLTFIAIIIIGMFGSDVLSGSAGINFYAFFNALFLFGNKTYHM